jgi:phospholipid/cholesterol/gamma-HCH transport system substrate-binding protein
MGEQTKNMLIGVFVILASALIIFFIMFLRPSVGDGKKTLYVRFSNVNSINVGTRVLFAGRPVGEVTQISQIYDAREQPVDALGQVYFFQLTLRVDSSVNVYNTDEITLQTSGLLGEKSIAIIPKAPPKGVTPVLITDQPIYADSVDPIQNAFLELSQVANDMEATFQEATKWIQANGESLGDAVRSFGSAMDQATITLNTVNQEKLVEEIRCAAHNFSLAMEELDDALAELKQQNAYANLADTFANMKEVSGTIASGKGTIGRLVKSEDLYLRVNAILSKMDTLMNDINHYGIFFNLNKGWQRTRTKRLNELNALETPQDFKRYFTTEVDQINTSLERLSMLIDKAQVSPEKETILQSERFKKDFAELLREVDELHDNLKLYNEQLMEADAP